MPNAQDADQRTSPDRFLITGITGSGKSQLFTTLPGKKFMYIFDPNALGTLQGFDIDYEEFIVDKDDVDLAVKALKKDVGDKSTRKVDPKTYVNWEKHFDEHWDKGFFQDYDWIGFDSFTLFADTVMDRLLYLNGRTGKQPEQDDWAAQVNTIGNVFRVFANQKMGIYCTGHLDERQDELTKKIWHRPMMTGRLRVRIPLLFNNVLVSHAEGDSEGTLYQVQTVPDKMFPVVRTNLKGLDMYEDVTIPKEAFQDKKLLSNYGLGALLQKAGHGPVTPKSTSRATSQKRK